MDGETNRVAGEQGPGGPQLSPVRPGRQVVTAELSLERVRQLQALAQHAEDLRRQNRELARHVQALTALISAAGQDLDGLAGWIVEVVLGEYPHTSCSLFLTSKNCLDIERRVSAGVYSLGKVEKSLTRDDPGMVAEAIRGGKLFNVGDVRALPAYQVSWEQARSEMVVPLCLGVETIGAIRLQSAEAAAFHEQDEKFLRAFASQAAVLLENARLAQGNQLQFERTQALRSLDEMVNANMDLPAAGLVLLENILRLLGVDAARLLRFDWHNRVLSPVCTRGIRPSAHAGGPLRMDQGLAGRVASERSEVHFERVQEQPGLAGDSSRLFEEGFCEYYGMPLLVSGSLKGVLEILGRAPLPRDDGWKSFLYELAGRVAFTMERIELFENLNRRQDALLAAFDDSLSAVTRLLEMRDPEIEDHSQRVEEITDRLARAAGITGEELQSIRWGARLHDIGKIVLSDAILKKQGKLSQEDWQEMLQHPANAREVLSPITLLGSAVDIPYCHHERWDGNGYPRGLKGEQIPFAARLFSIVDVWDALISPRRYREMDYQTWTKEKAREYIREQAGKSFDPAVVELFLGKVLADQAEDQATVLIVDGDAEEIGVLASVLDKDYLVLSAPSGLDALQIALRVHLAVVVCDQQLADMKGLDLLRRIVKTKPHTVGILLSNRSDVELLSQAINQPNVRGFLLKPCDLDLLLRKVAEGAAEYQVLERQAPTVFS